MIDDTMGWGAQSASKQPQPVDCVPVGWITTEQLDDEVFNAIQADSSSCGGDGRDFGEIDDYLGDDEEYEDEADQRRSTLRLLASLRPQLAELLGFPPAE
jgi:hypothetical protein